MNSSGVTIAIYDSHEAAEKAVKSLRTAGIDFRKISIVGKDYHSEEQPVGYFNMGDRAKFFGKFGAFWGTLAGILLGAFVMVVPVFGHIVVLGPLAATVVSGIEGAAIGGAGGALVGALTGVGVPRDSAIRYQTAIEAGQFLLMVQGSQDDVGLAESVLRPSEAVSLETHGEAEPTPA
jgi:uncharacterized membrane protein